MSRRDLAHVLSALWDVSGGEAGVGVQVAAIDDAIGRSRRDMRTPLNLESLREQGLADRRPDGTWSLTPAGIDWLREDRELSRR